MKSKRIVFDSLDILLTWLGDTTILQCEITRLHNWLLENELTALVTARTSRANEVPSHALEFIPFLDDRPSGHRGRCGESATHRAARFARARLFRRCPARRDAWRRILPWSECPHHVIPRHGQNDAGWRIRCGAGTRLHSVRCRGPQAGGCGGAPDRESRPYGREYTRTPRFTVPITRISLMAIGSTVNGFASSITKSATRPAAIVPLDPSSKF